MVRPPAVKRVSVSSLNEVAGIVVVPADILPRTTVEANLFAVGTTDVVVLVVIVPVMILDAGKYNTISSAAIRHAPFYFKWIE
jgi:hypothetical protein